MQNPSNQRLIVIGLYVNAVLLAAGLLVLCMRGSIPSMLPAAYGQNQPAIGGGGGVYVVPAQFNTNSYGCYLLDIDQRTICAYQYVPAQAELRLVAARNFNYDRHLKNFNSAGPSPQDVKEMVDREMQGNRAQEQNPAR